MPNARLRGPGLVMLLVCSSYAIAQEAQVTPVKLNIAAQPLGKALNAWASQTGYQILIPASAEQGRTAPSVNGRYTPEGALKILLASSDLRYEFVGTRAVTIREGQGDSSAAGAKSSAPPPAGKAKATVEGERPLVMAQNRLRDSEEAVGAGSEIAEDEEIERPGARVTEQVVVTGTHISGVVNSTAPLVIIDRAAIDSTGRSNAPSLLATVTQNFALQNPAGVFVPGTTDAGEHGSSINLRGIGEGTTLVLLNGHRLAPGFLSSAVDISALPLSAMERVEILLEGASATYGSDAVGGVVNFVMRRDYSGAETRVRTAWTEDGAGETRASQLVGGSWKSGNALLALEFYKRNLLSASERDFVPPSAAIGSLYPRDKNYSILFSGRQDLAASTQVFADALFTRRETFNRGGQVVFNENNDATNPQISATAGIDWKLGSGWQVELATTFAKNKLDLTSLSDAQGTRLFDSRFTTKEADLKADGVIATLPTGKARAAIGASWRRESFDFQQVAFGSTSEQNAQQTVRSAFTEFMIPLISEDKTRKGAEAIELSLAARYDDYSTFGSSVDPRLGLMWEPVSWIRARVSYGTSYVAPRLFDQDPAANVVVAAPGADPNASSGLSYQLIAYGTNAGGLTPQKSRNWSGGFEFSSERVKGLKGQISYYRIKYYDRIALPPNSDVILSNPSAFGSLIVRDPSPEDVERFLSIGRAGQGVFAFDSMFNPTETVDPASVQVIIDNRRRNLSTAFTDGIDLSIQYATDVGRGSLNLGFDGTHILHLTQRLAPTSAPLDSVDTIYNPPAWRARATVGWQQAGWNLSLFGNYTDSYTDNRTPTTVPIGSYATLDMRLAYDVGHSHSVGALAGLSISAGVQNLFNREPPGTRVIRPTTDMGFDPTNADPLGRQISFEVQKRW